MEEKKDRYLFGMHPVLEAVRSGKKFDKVLLKKGLEGDQFRELLSLLTEKGISFQFVPGERLNKAVRGAHQGVIAYISQIDYVSIEDMVNNALATTGAPVFIMLDGVSDVRNLGAIARSLECAGGNGIIVPAKGGAAINADALKQSGFKLIAATEKVDRLMYDTDMTGPCAIIMGSEDKGISQAMLDLADDKVRIPMTGQISSLNVSVAASVMVYECVRQRLKK